MTTCLYRDKNNSAVFGTASLVCAIFTLRNKHCFAPLYRHQFSKSASLVILREYLCFLDCHLLMNRTLICLIFVGNCCSRLPPPSNSTAILDLRTGDYHDNESANQIKSWGGGTDGRTDGRTNERTNERTDKMAAKRDESRP